MIDEIKLRSIQKQDSTMISNAFALQGWDKPSSLYDQYFLEQKTAVRDVIIADYDRDFAGYLTIIWNSRYEPFRVNRIPEIVDLNVLQKYQRKGIATALMNEAEQRISVRSSQAGVGFGVTKDYGAAQILYIKRGYIPDGNGLVKTNKPIQHGEYLKVDDGVVFYLIKELR